MNKNALKIVALALAVSGAVTLAPTELNLGTKVVYAADTNSSDLSSLKIQTSSGSTIRTYDDNDYDSDNKVDSGDMKSDIQYYAKTSSKKIKVKIDGVDDKYVRVFTNDSSSSKGEKINKSISLDSGNTRLTVRVYSEEPDKDNPKYSDDDYKLSDYTIKVKYTGDDDDDDDDSSDYDDIYLDDLTLTYSGDDIDFDFDKDKTSYDIDVKKDVSYVKVAAEPEDDEYKVKINDSRVKDDDDYEKKVNLNEGENKIEVKITDDDDNERVYTLNITRGSSSSSNTSTDTSSDGTSTDDTNTSNANGWSIQDGNVYYLDNSGKKQTGWLTIGSDWYYLDSDGVRKTGWQNVSGNWYHMDGQGKMQTGWFKDWNGAWYYLKPYSDGTKGAMLHDTYVGGYRLGSDGAWVK